MGTRGGRLEDLYREHSGAAVRLAYLLTGDGETAQDLVQDAFIRVAARLGHLRDPQAFGPYLRQTVVNLARMHFRRQKVERAFRQRGHRAESTVEPQDVVAREALKEALGRLPWRQRVALVLRFYEDMPDPQIAEVLRCSQSNVRSLVARGLAALRRDDQGALDERTV